MIKFQTRADYAIINGDYEITKKMAEIAPSEVILFGRGDIEEKFSLKIPGKHNYENAAAALVVARLAGVEDKVTRSVFETFGGLEHRLQVVSVKNGVKYVDDSISTNPATVVAAIKAFGEPKILILGGSDKKADFDKMAEEITTDNSVKAILLTGYTADQLENDLEKAGFDRPLIKVEGMDQIVKKASELAVSGDVVLLSPACASFGEYIDYKDRGEQFQRSVNSLQ